MTGGAPALGWERWATVWPEAEPLFQQHHDAVGSELLGHHEIDTEQAAALDAAGAMLFATGRREARLEAYCMWYLVPNIKSRGTVLALQGPWFATVPGFGMKVLDWSLRDLQTKAHAAIVHHWPNEPRLGALFARRYAAVPNETSWVIPFPLSPKDR